MATSQDACYISLLGLAEYFRTTQPPNIRKCVQSLQALFTFKPPTKMEARTHLQMGQVLMAYTKNTELARSHLEQAVSVPRCSVQLSRAATQFYNVQLSILIFSGCCRRTLPPSTT